MEIEKFHADEKIKLWPKNHFSLHACINGMKRNKKSRPRRPSYSHPCTETRTKTCSACGSSTVRRAAPRRSRRFSGRASGTRRPEQDWMCVHVWVWDRVKREMVISKLRCRQIETPSHGPLLVGKFSFFPSRILSLKNKLNQSLCSSESYTYQHCHNAFVPLLNHVANDLKGRMKGFSACAWVRN